MRIRLLLRILPALVLAQTPLTSGCSKTSLAIGAMEPILANTKTAALASSDIRTFQAATPANITLLEGLVATDPDNRNFRIDLAMLYFSYAFTHDDAVDADYASTLYQKGFEHGKVALLDNDKVAEAWDQPFDVFEESMAALDEDDLEALMWTVSNWSQFIGLHLDSTEVLLAIPRVMALLDRAVEIDGSFFGALPHVMLGSLHAFRPPMLGGDPEASKTNFDEAVQLTEGRFLLAKYFFAQYYCHRILDDVLFEETLRDVMSQSDDIWPEYRLLNALAIRKSRQLLREKDELF